MASGIRAAIGLAVLVALTARVDWGASPWERAGGGLAWAQDGGDSSALINNVRNAMEQGRQAVENRPVKPPPATAQPLAPSGPAEPPCPGGGMRLLGICSGGAGTGSRPRP